MRIAALLLTAVTLASATQIVVEDEVAASCGSWPGWAGIRTLFIFGNSYTAMGFETSGTAPNAQNPFGNPPYPGWTSANNQPVWPGYLTMRYNASKILAYNLAYGGATVDGTLIKSYVPTVASVGDQVEKSFLPLYAQNKSLWAPESSLFAIWIGVNDVGNSYWGKNSSLIDAVFTRYSNLLGELYAAGARNFVFLDVPPLQRTPLTKAGPKEGIPLEEAAVKDWNKRLGAMVDTLRKRSGVTAWIVSSYTIFDKAMDNPAAYKQTAGLKDTGSFCEAYGKGTPKPDTKLADCKYKVNEYFWYNNLHPSTAVHDAVAAEVARALKSIPASTGVCRYADSFGGRRRRVRM
ncbi:hypothetical protein EJ06DRAFT_481860 [Trichodelitschia bisporula]|uniref:Carbohydrate esterase family 16 protein n=1 Tax=Trichodelitschia bisporula TaxID=703511 RepID=A0A6G1HN76_9PEZI|nr:hypothetical protein EJ06DRAFT_481860 [Trichodelitschia bisporula]